MNNSTATNQCEGDEDDDNIFEFDESVVNKKESCHGQQQTDATDEFSFFDEMFFGKDQDVEMNSVLKHPEMNCEEHEKINSEEKHEEIDSEEKHEEKCEKLDDGDLSNQTEKNEFQCFVCDCLFDDYTDLETHMKTHEKENPHECFICKSSFSTLSVLKDHISKTHVNLSQRQRDMPVLGGISEKDDTHECFICKCLFTSVLSLKEHITKMHVNKKRCFFPCSQCKSSFLTVSDLKEHKREEHAARRKIKPAVKKTYTCFLCNCVCGNYSRLIIHMKSHGEIKSYTCFICHETLESKDDLDSHRKRLHKEDSGERVKCSICGATFSTIYNLKSHTKRIHCDTALLKHGCSICNRRFFEKYTLDAHMRGHTGERPYKCEMCDKAFSIKLILTNHVRSVHLKEKKYQCLYCDKTFSAGNNCKRHMTKHTGERRFLCSLCGAAFKDKGALNYHEQTHSNS